MTAFQSAREAKEFLASRIVEEAKRESLPLSEVERKMLYFSETHWTLPDISSVSEEFDREYNQDEYEKKITRLIREAAIHDRQVYAEQYDLWWDAIRVLKKEDHYILVMVDCAGLRPVGGSRNTEEQLQARQSIFRRIMKGSPGNRVIACGSIALMLFFLIMLLMQIKNLPTWVIPSLGLLLFLLCLLTMVFLLLQGIHAIWHKSKGIASSSPVADHGTYGSDYEPGNAGEKW